MIFFSLKMLCTEGGVFLKKKYEFKTVILKNYMPC
jgi:hypothetical protein